MTPVRFNNQNHLFGAVFARTLENLGAKNVIVSPGSRNTPLTYALAENGTFEMTPVLDERSAGFYALGIAKATHQPAVLLCTSGTAVANYHPAILEAHHSQTPLLIVTADRPPDQQNCGAGQTIEQNEIFNRVAIFKKFTPQKNLKKTLSQLQIRIASCWEIATATNRPVHFNFPLKEPLAPTVSEKNRALQKDFSAEFFHEKLGKITKNIRTKNPDFSGKIRDWTSKFSRGLVIAGAENPNDTARYCANIQTFAAGLKWPILADVLNPLRHHANGTVPIIWNYNDILRDENFTKKSTPDAVIQIGILPTGKTLRNWLSQPSVPFLCLSKSGENLHPLGQKTTRFAFDFEKFSIANAEKFPRENIWSKLWENAANAVEKRFDEDFENDTGVISEEKIPVFLQKILPDDTAVFFANSMTVRHAERFWKADNSRRKIFANRGVNGIDGTLGTALGVANGTGAPTVLITGDLALLHDANAFLIAPEFGGRLTILLVNNRGGAIFKTLPVANGNPHFEKFWLTPQKVDFAKLAGAHNIEYQKIETWKNLRDALEKPFHGIRLFEISA